VAIAAAADRRVQARELRRGREREVVRESGRHRGLDHERTRAAPPRDEERAAASLVVVDEARGEEREARERGGERVEERRVGGVGRGIGEQHRDVVGGRHEVEHRQRHLRRWLRRRRGYHEAPLHLHVHAT